MAPAIIGVDLAKSVFQVHGVDKRGKVVVTRRLSRHRMLEYFATVPPCVVGMEACATAHHWARELGRLGHTVRLMPPQYVKPFVKRQKNDRADAEAICEAVQRPTMRFVPIKTVTQQGMLVIHRTRELLVRQRTQLINALRGHLAEFGVVAPQGTWNVGALTARVADPDEERIPAVARAMLQVLIDQMRALDTAIEAIDRQLHDQARADETCQRLLTVPGIGPVTATALVATIGDGRNFRSGRHLAAWLGLVPQQHSSGGKEVLGGISKAGDGYLRRMLVHGARSVMYRCRSTVPWLKGLSQRRPFNVATVALANKTARIAWAVLTQGSTYRLPSAPAAVRG